MARHAYATLVTTAEMPVQKSANLAAAPLTEGTGPDLPDQLQDLERMPNIMVENESTPPNLNAQQDADALRPIPVSADFTMDATVQIAAQPTGTQAATAPTGVAGAQANPLDLSKSNWWSVGRLGARALLYGSAHTVVSPAVAQRWPRRSVRRAGSASLDMPAAMPCAPSRIWRAPVKPLRAR